MLDALRSQFVISNAGRGGRTQLPWAHTERSVSRVTTFMYMPDAIRASVLIVDTFLMVHSQVAAGARGVGVGDPSRCHSEPDTMEQSCAPGRRLMVALNNLLVTVIDMLTSESIDSAGLIMTARALGNHREQLRCQRLEDLKLEAEARLNLQEAEKAAVEIEGRKLDNFEKGIELVQNLIAMPGI